MRELRIYSLAAAWKTEHAGLAGLSRKTLNLKKVAVGQHSVELFVGRVWLLCLAAHRYQADSWLRRVGTMTGLFEDLGFQRLAGKLYRALAVVAEQDTA